MKKKTIPSNLEMMKATRPRFVAPSQVRSDKRPVRLARAEKLAQKGDC